MDKEKIDAFIIIPQCLFSDYFFWQNLFSELESVREYYDFENIEKVLNNGY